MTMLVVLLLSPVLLWALFLTYCAIMASRRSGKFYRAPWPVRALSYALLAMLVVVDVAFNFTVASVLFLELPDVHKPMLTERCASHLASEGWRGDIARWVCTGWLNPFEENHCR